jgi:hypothetical protein
MTRSPFVNVISLLQGVIVAIHAPAAWLSFAAFNGGLGGMIRQHEKYDTSNDNQIKHLTVAIYGIHFSNNIDDIRR